MLSSRVVHCLIQYVGLVLYVSSGCSQGGKDKLRYRTVAPLVDSYNTVQYIIRYSGETCEVLIGQQNS